PEAAVDLRDPKATCRLTLFLYRATRAVDGHGVGNKKGHRWQWRADLEDDAMLSHADYSRGDCINMWATEVYKEVIDRCASLTICRSSFHLIRGPAIDSSWGFSFVKQSDGKQSRAQRYFVTRGVIFCSARTGLYPWGKVPQAFIQSTSLLWFYGNPAKTILKDICTDQQKLVTELLKAHARNSHTVLGYMTEGIQSVVERSLCAVLQVVQMARTTDALKDVVVEGEDVQARQVRNEATYRHQWDQLFHLVVSSSGISDIGYEREATLRYPEYSAPVNIGSGDPDTDNNIGRMFSAVHPADATATLSDREKNAYWVDGLKDKSTTPRSEPLKGIADGILYLTIPDAFRTAGAAKDVCIWAPKMVVSTEESDLQAAFADDREPSKYAANAFAWKCERSLPSDADRAAYRTLQAQRYDAHAESVVSDAASLALEASSSPAPMSSAHVHAENEHVEAPRARRAVPKSSGSVRSNHLYIPLLACEYKRLLKLWSAGAATNQERLYLIAICIFIRLFNLRFPVFGLITSGPCGIISCAWNEILYVETDIKNAYREKIDTKKEHTPAIFIADEEAMRVDLRNPLDALNVATFIAYLMVVHAPRVRQLFDNLEHVDESVAEYLLDSHRPTPLHIARNMTEEDKKWHKPGQTPKDDDTKTATTAGSVQLGMAKKSNKVKSTGSRPTSDLEPITEEQRAM
ncbi:hypothetical protein HDZ31DRAFT_37042, partial [Schizophyllum fasciatum]